MHLAVKYFKNFLEKCVGIIKYEIFSQKRQEKKNLFPQEHSQSKKEKNETSF